MADQLEVQCVESAWKITKRVNAFNRDAHVDILVKEIGKNCEHSGMCEMHILQNIILISFKLELLINLF